MWLFATGSKVASNNPGGIKHYNMLQIFYEQATWSPKFSLLLKEMDRPG